MLKDTEYAYLAGLADGDGCLEKLVQLKKEGK